MKGKDLGRNDQTATRNRAHRLPSIVDSPGRFITAAGNRLIVTRFVAISHAIDRTPLDAF